MSAALQQKRYIGFDTIEIDHEQEFKLRAYKRLQPLKSGDRVPSFFYQKDHCHWQQFVNGVIVHGPSLLNRLADKALVIAFYSAHWHTTGLQLLKQLSQLSAEIKARDTNLLIVAAEKDSNLEKLAWDNNLSLSFYFDQDNQIAGKFGVYSDLDPTWDHFSGIDVNVPLLSTYVISRNGKIVYDHINRDCSDTFPRKELVAAVNRTTVFVGDY
ncbi:MAG: redoxin domain-containing protein [Bacteroidetes bacterium]|nr:redoxin domain-containing protein [Bacteroidota bacterium]